METLVATILKSQTTVYYWKYYFQGFISRHAPPFQSKVKKKEVYNVSKKVYKHLL
jgi:hypothetical protein